MNSFYLMFLTSIYAGTFSSCICDCFSEREADIQVRFNKDSSGGKGFKRNEMQGFLIIENNTDTQRFENGFIYDYRIWNEVRSSTYTNPTIYRIVNDSLHLKVEINNIGTLNERSGGLFCKCDHNKEINFKMNGIEHHKSDLPVLIEK